MSDTPSDYSYPVSMKTAREYAKLLFEPLNRGECVTSVWVPMAGRRTVTNFLIENRHLFPEFIPQKSDKKLLVYVEPLDLAEESLAGYLRLMAESLADEYLKNGVSDRDGVNGLMTNLRGEPNDYASLLQILKDLIQLIAKEDHDINFFLGEFDELKFVEGVFSNNLKSIWSKFQTRVSFSFLVREDITTASQSKRFGELNEALMQNVVYIRLVKEDIDYLLKRNEKLLNCTFTEEEKQVISEVCGAHPFLIKAATRIIALMKKDKVKVEDAKMVLMSHFQLRSAVQKIFDLRNESEKKILVSIVMGKGVTEEAALVRLEKLGLVYKEGSDYSLFSELFSHAVKRDLPELDEPKNGHQGLVLNKESGGIFLEGRQIEDLFSRQEYDLLTFFVSEPDTIHSRDRIGEVLWGKDSYDKYSDWAIDQIISKLRKKLMDVGVGKESLKTLRGRGYKFSCR